MSDDPYMAAAEALFAASDLDARLLGPAIRTRAWQFQFRAAVDAAREPLLDENARLNNLLQDICSALAMPGGELVEEAPKHAAGLRARIEELEGQLERAANPYIPPLPPPEPHRRGRIVDVRSGYGDTRDRP